MTPSGAQREETLDLDELVRLEQSLPAAPWGVRGCEKHLDEEFPLCRNLRDAFDDPVEKHVASLRALALARNALPALLAELLSSRRERERLRAALQDAVESVSNGPAYCAGNHSIYTPQIGVSQVERWDAALRSAAPAQNEKES